MAEPAVALDVAEALEAQVFEALAAWVRRQLGIVFSSEQKEQFADRLRTYISTRQLTPQQLLVGLERGDHTLTRQMAEVVSTNYTFFMRESETFDFMRQNIFPLFPAEQVRIWSAAASSGDEAYTVAMYGHEKFGTETPRRIKILGTDISQRQIEQAESGLYPSDQLSLLSSQRKAQWFEPGPDARRLRVAKPLRDLCMFRRMNLTQFPWPFEHRFQVILLRNVLYYLERPTRQRILECCYDVAAPGAWLLTSLTEPMLDIRTRWRRVAPAIYQRMGT